MYKESRRDHHLLESFENILWKRDIEVRKSMERLCQQIKKGEIQGFCSICPKNSLNKFYIE